MKLGWEATGSGVMCEGSSYTKGSLLLNELKQKFMARWKCHDLGKTTEFLGMHISHDCKNRKIY